MTTAELIVKAVLDELDGRGGFDHWWEEIDRETRQDIVESLEHRVTKILG